jgi:2'-5' RNA ligase
MIAFFPPASVTDQLVALAEKYLPKYAEKPKDMHLTLAYLGEAADLNPDDVAEMQRDLTSVAENIAPLQGTINGITRFVDSDPNPLVLNFDAPGLAALRGLLLSSARSEDIDPVLNHGFTPHVTIGYLPKDIPTPEMDLTPIPCQVDSFTLTLANKRSDYPLLGSTSLSEFKDRTLMTNQVSEAGVYDVSVSETGYDADSPDEVWAYIPKDGPPSGRKLKIGDAAHVHDAVEAVANGAYRGNELDIPESATGAIKERVATAVRKFFSGDDQKRLLDWLHTGKKPDETTASTGSVKEIRLSTPVFAFRGQYPDVPLAPGVDFDKLTAEDRAASTEPLFVVRPLGVLNAVSDNGLKYDDQLLREIEQQVLTKKPAARQGHVSEEASSWEFPDDVALWVGALRQGDTLFGKAYIYPKTPFHQMVLKRKAAGSTLSNSIWGKGNFETNADGTQRLRNLDLETIDFAPAERASLDALGGKFETTSEMSNKGVSEMTPEELRERVKQMAPHELHEMMSAEQRQHCAEMRVREMEPSAVYEMLPAAHRQGVHECFVKEFGQTMPAAEMKQISEMTTRVTELEKRDAENRTQLAEYRQREFDDTLDKAAAAPFAGWNVTTDQGKAAIVSARDNFKMYIVAQMAGMDGGNKKENIDAAATAAWPKYEPQAALLRTSLSGGNVIVGVQGSVAEQTQNNFGYDPKTGRYTEESAKQARAQVMGG